MPSAAELSKGTNAPVATSRVRAVLAWTTGADTPKVDASALLLDASGKLRSDDDFVFYNQPAHTSGTVRHVGETAAGASTTDVLEVHLHAVSPDVDRAVLGASADGGTFGEVPDLSRV